MGLINGKLDIKSSFLREWAKYVTAILAYGENSSKRKVYGPVKDLDLTGNNQYFAIQH